MSIDWVDDVLKFSQKFGCLIGQYPRKLHGKDLELAKSLINEEVNKELLPALDGDSLADIADAAIDSIYVIIQLLTKMGVDPRPIWDEVQRANMAKEGGGKREDGKILKPPGWQPPNILQILEKQSQTETFPEFEKKVKEYRVKDIDNLFLFVTNDCEKCRKQTIHGFPSQSDRVVRFTDIDNLCVKFYLKCDHCSHIRVVEKRLVPIYEDSPTQ